jgi:hypothetical protein
MSYELTSSQSSKSDLPIARSFAGVGMLFHQQG